LAAELLTPVLSTVRPGADADPNEVRYFLSFMRLRTYVGVLGLALPVVVPLVDWIVFSGDPAPRGSISAYYYSGARELFVAILAATGVFMISYKVAERDDRRVDRGLGIRTLMADEGSRDASTSSTSRTNRRRTPGATDSCGELVTTPSETGPRVGSFRGCQDGGGRRRIGTRAMLPALLPAPLIAVVATPCVLRSSSRRRRGR
jgi:hypothetical protein